MVCPARVDRHTLVLELLLARGADPEQAMVDRGRFTPLIMASAGGHVDAVRALLCAGVSPNTARADNGGTALHMAAVVRWSQQCPHPGMLAPIHVALWRASDP